MCKKYNHADFNPVVSIVIPFEDTFEIYDDCGILFIGEKKEMLRFYYILLGKETNLTEREIDIFSCLETFGEIRMIKKPVPLQLKFLTIWESMIFNIANELSPITSSFAVTIPLAFMYFALFTHAQPSGL